MDYEIPIRNYQEEQELEPLEPPDATSAVIGMIYEDGVTLIFDGNKSPTNKRYKVNTSIIFAPGDRVKLTKDSKTYIVEFPFGAPKLEESIVKLAERAIIADDAGKLNGKEESNLEVKYAFSARKIMDSDGSDDYFWINANANGNRIGIYSSRADRWFTLALEG